MLVNAIGTVRTLTPATTFTLGDHEQVCNAVRSCSNLQYLTPGEFRQLHTQLHRPLSSRNSDLDYAEQVSGMTVAHET